MELRKFLTKYEIKSHEDTFSKNIHDTNLPLFLAMQSIYANSLEKYIETHKNVKNNKLIVDELTKTKDIIELANNTYNEKYNGINVFENNIETKLYVESKIKKDIKPILKQYVKRSKIFDVIKNNRIDLIYVY